MEAGQVDLVLGYVGKPPAGFSYAPLMEDGICALVHEDHPLVDQEIAVEDLEQYSVIRHSSWMGSPHFIRDYLESLSANIRVVAKTPNLPIGLQLVKDTCHLLITMEKAARSNTYVQNMKMKTLPVKLPRVKYYAVWPEYWEHNRAHRWFREFIINRFRLKLKEIDRHNAVINDRT
nr:LysR substrate-binding domain-containing protein [Endozoicomonas sp. SCSIO W0465]